MNKQHMTKVSILGFTLLILGILLFFAYRYNLFNINADEDAGTPIPNTATVTYCSGDTGSEDSSKCDPATNKYSGATTSNTVTTTIQNPTPTPKLNVLCLTIKLQNRGTGSQKHNKVAYSVFEVNGSTAIVSGTAATDTTGALKIVDTLVTSKLDFSKSYKVTAKPLGYLVQTVANSPISDCVTVPTNPIGDLDNTNDITLRDLVVGIRAYNGVSNEAAQEAYLGLRPKLTDLLDLIKNFHQYR